MQAALRYTEIRTATPFYWAVMLLLALMTLFGLAGAVRTAERIGEQDPDAEATIVFVVCDGGWKYLSTGAWTGWTA